MSANDEKPPWDVLVIGGASGTGKTSASYPIARRFGVALTEIDDLHITARRLTTPAEQPVLHYWFMHPEAATEMSPEAIVEMQISVSRAMAPAVTAVIANHIETQMPVVLEGDYVLPELVATAGDRVRGVFLYEPEEDVIVRNLTAREAGEYHRKRGQVGVLYGQWMKDECERLGLPALQARPWDTIIERILDAVA